MHDIFVFVFQLTFSFSKHYLLTESVTQVSHDMVFVLCAAAFPCMFYT